MTIKCEAVYSNIFRLLLNFIIFSAVPVRCDNRNKIRIYEQKNFFLLLNHNLSHCHRFRLHHSNSLFVYLILFEIYFFFSPQFFLFVRVNAVKQWNLIWSTFYSIIWSWTKRWIQVMKRNENVKMKQGKKHFTNTIKLKNVTLMVIFVTRSRFMMMTLKWDLLFYVFFLVS